MKMFNGKLISFIFLFFIGIVYSFPTFFNLDYGEKINLGLDLQGGSHILLEINENKAVENNYKSLLMTTKYISDKEDILIDNLKQNKENISFSILDIDDFSKLKKSFDDVSGIEISQNKEKIIINYTKEQVNHIKEIAINKTIQTIRNRLDMFGLSEPSVLKNGTNRVIVQLPGINNLSDEQKALDLIMKEGKMEILPVLETITNNSDYITFPDVKDNNITYYVSPIPIITGENINKSMVSHDKNNKPSISYELDSIGSKMFADYTANNIGKRTAIVLDGKVYSAPQIAQRIGGGSVQITGDFSIQEASTISIALSSGALSAPVKLIEKRSIGPSLGEDSIKTSLISLISGFIGVVIFMIIFYGFSGVVSNIALIVNVLLIVSIMSMLGATLTLPGMAGIVLTVGMAVDSNVIINERIKEFLREGNSITKSIEEGYSNAMRSILDANITTLLAAFILYGYGTGPIKGFAITISIGILVSMITSIIGTKGIYEFILSRNKYTLNKEKWFKA